MNIKDVSKGAIPKPGKNDRLELIFQRQEELMQKYQVIEGHPDWPLDIDNKEHQVVLKDFFWRATEEMAETWEAYLEHKDPDHYLEEISDALHFVVEAFILSNTTVNIDHGGDSIERYMDKKIKESTTIEHLDRVSFRLHIFDFLYRLGLVGNTLKNKPWKQSQVLTDKKKFYNCMNEMFTSFLNMCCRFGLDADDLYYLYFQKSMVNKFRISSKY